MKITPIIGLEVHVQITTKTKAFCACSTDYFGKEPNTLVCPVCMGLPGALPVLNQELVRRAVLLGLALGSHINQNCYFERKNYFYPDNPKGYQISQKALPILTGGSLKIKDDREILIEEIHIEDDAAKSIHEPNQTLVDFNKAGMPLFEIVTKPCLQNPEEVELYANKLQQIIRYLDISDADIEKGNMRIEPTVNLKIENEIGEVFYTPLVEVKNIASMKFAKNAVAYEIDRQFEKWQEDGEVKSSTNKTTRGYDSVKNSTFLQREKEEAADYRYFPEPDLPPLEISADFIEEQRQLLPELPGQKISRYISLGISPVDAEIITQDKSFADKFDICLGRDGIHLVSKDYAKFLSNRFLGSCKPLIKNSNNLNKNLFLESFSAVSSGSANTNTINEALRQSLETGRPLTDFYKPQTSDLGEIEKIVKQIIDANPKAVEDYKKNPASIGFLLGQVIKASAGTASPQIAKQVLEKLLN